MSVVLSLRVEIVLGYWLRWALCRLLRRYHASAPYVIIEHTLASQRTGRRSFNFTWISFDDHICCILSCLALFCHCHSLAHVRKLAAACFELRSEIFEMPAVLNLNIYLPTALCPACVAFFSLLQLCCLYSLEKKRYNFTN